MAAIIAHSTSGVKSRRIPRLDDEAREVMTALAEGAGHSIIIKPMYVRMCDGDLALGAMLSYLAYWHSPDAHGRTRLRVSRDGHLWVATSARQWDDELCLSQKVVRRCQEWLVEAGWVEKRVWTFDSAPTVHMRLTRAFLEARERWLAAQVDALDEDAEDVEEPVEDADVTQGEFAYSPKGNLEITQRAQSITVTPTGTTGVVTRERVTPTRPGAKSEPEATPLRVQGSGSERKGKLRAADGASVTDDAHRAVVAAIADAVAEGDAARAKALLAAHGSRVGKQAKQWLAGGGTASSFRAEYGRGGRWYTMPCRFAVDASGYATIPPTLDTIAKTIGQLDGFAYWGAAKQRPQEGAVAADVRPMSDEESRALEAQAQAERERQAAETLAAMPPAWRERILARRAEAARA